MKKIIPIQINWSRFAIDFSAVKVSDLFNPASLFHNLNLIIKIFLNFLALLFLVLSLYFLWSVLSIKNVLALELLSIDFFQEQAGEISKIEFTFDGPSAKGKKFHIAEDKQVIVDLEDVHAEPRVLRPFDTSEFTGSVVMVSPYLRPGSEKDIRIAIQLRDNVRSMIEKKENKLTLSIENRFGAFSKTKLEQAKKEEVSVKKGEEANNGTSKINIPKGDSIQDILDNIVLSGPKKFIGKKISINVKNMGVGNLLKMIADSSGFNIIIEDDVVGKVPNLSLVLTNVPWDQALDTIMQLGKLVAIKTGNILLIKTMSKAAEDEKIKAEAKNLTEKQEPLVTKIFPISFAENKDLVDLLKQYSTKDRGLISQDARTNSIIVKDTMETIEKMKKIVEYLDTQTPQVLIESKIVEAQESMETNLGLVNGVQFGYDPISENITDQVTKKINNTGPGFGFSTSGNGASITSGGVTSRTIGAMGLTITNLHRLVNLDLQLQLMESESKVKIVSSPKVITQNKKPAEIVSTDTQSFQTVTTAASGSTSTSFQDVNAILSLKVTPQVTNDGSIVLEVDLNRGTFGAPKPINNGVQPPPDRSNRSIKTNVLVDNGSTIVIGGLYEFSKTESHQGIPFLKDLPIVGWLFRTSYHPQKKKTELIIFITPRVINQQEAGMTDKDDTLG